MRYQQLRYEELKHRLLIERPHTLRDDIGGERMVWTAVATVWAKIAPIKGYEAIKAGQILADMDTRIIVRWSALLDTMTATWRLSHNNVTYRIVSIAHKDLAHQVLEIMAKNRFNGD